MTLTPANTRFTLRWVFVMFCLLCLFAYYNSLMGAFVMDDYRIIADANLGNPFLSDLRARPLVAITLAINYWIDRTNPRTLHLTNILIHISAAMVLFELVRRITELPRFRPWYRQRSREIAFVIAAVWLVHPLNTQSVTYTVQRAESLAGLFFLVAVYCHFRAGQSEGRYRTWMWASLGANILGTASKELMISLPFFLLLFDRAAISGTWRGAIRKWAWYLAHLVPPIAQVVLLSVGGIISGTKTVGFDVMVFTPKTYFLTQMEVICHYLRLSFWPSNLTLDYLDWPERKSLTEVWPFALVLIMLGSATAWGVLKNRLWGMIAAGFFLYLGPTSSIMPIQDAAFEHRMYLPLVSLVVLVVLGLAMTVRWLQVLIPDRRGLIQQVAVAGVSVVVFSLAFRTVVRNADYASPLSLYRQNFESRPNNPRVMAVYANMLSTTGNRDQALELMGRAVTLPRLNWTWNIDYAEMLHKSGKTESGLAVLDALHAGNPTDANINQHRALYYMSLNRMAEAERAFRLVLEHQPENWHSQFYLSVVLWDLQREGEARALWKSLTEKDPAFLPARAEQVRDYVKDPGAQAIQFPVMAKVALAVDRGVGQSDPRVADTLAMALARAGRFSEAVDAAQRAARLAEQAGWKPRLVALVRERAELYSSGRPYLPVELEQYRLGLK